jgi:hypothetical protein
VVVQKTSKDKNGRKYLAYIRVSWVLWVAVTIISGCNPFSEKVSISDPRVQTLMHAAESFHRTDYGFLPLPKTGMVYFESNPHDGYDAMLHLADGRTISFRKTEHGYEWTGEQQIFKGLKQYKSVDGALYEQITLTYEITHVSGYPLNRLNITYDGEDPRLANREHITLNEIGPVLREWGY